MGTAMRLGNSDSKGQGKIKFQLLPCSVATSFCGFFEEKANALSMASSKKWWAVFLDGYLRLYQFYGAAHEKHCLNLRKAHGIVVYNKPVIDGTEKPPIPPHFVIRMPDRPWTLQSVALGIHPGDAHVDAQNHDLVVVPLSGRNHLLDLVRKDPIQSVTDT